MIIVHAILLAVHKKKPRGLQYGTARVTDTRANIEKYER